MLEPLLIEMQQQLDVVILGLKTISESKNQKTVESSANEINSDQVLSQLEKLSQLVDDMDPESEDLAEELANQFNGHVYHEDFNALTKLIGDADFDEAEELINQLKTKISGE